MTNITFIKIPEQPVSKCYTDEFSFILKPSPIAGVGVFVTHKIKKGTRLRVFSGEPTRKMRMSEVKKNPVLAKFVEFFAVVSDGWVYLPANFSAMPVGWYMNHSDNPNAHHDEGYKYYASRDIEEGEEILINYHEL
jgi:SET domain-containing protein